VKHDILTVNPADRFLAAFSATSCGEVNKTKEEKQKRSQQKASGFAEFSGYKQYVRAVTTVLCWL
jgi:hypothetical protein